MTTLFSLIATTIMSVTTMVNNNIYTTDATITNVTNNVITCKTPDKNMWKFDNEVWSVGEKCKLVMHNNGTDTVYDDIILFTVK